MRATNKKDGFVPVVLTLETQTEVDAIFCVMNHYSLRCVLGLHDNDYKVLEGYASHEGAKTVHTKLCKMIR